MENQSTCTNTGAVACNWDDTAHAAQAWEEEMAVELKKQEAVYLIEQKQERNTVQAQG